MLTSGITFEDPYDIFEARFIVNAKRVCAALAVVALGLGAHDLMRARPHAAHAAFASAHDLDDAPSHKRAVAAVIPQKQAAKERKAAAAIAPRENAKPVVVASVEIAPQPMAQAKPKAHVAETVVLADSVAVAIPSAEKVVAPAPAAPQVASNVAANVTVKAASPLVAELAEARHLDAVEAAMGSATAMAKATPADMATLVALPQQAAAAIPVEARLVNAPLPRAKPVKLASLTPAAAVVPMPKPAPVSSPASSVAASQNALPAMVSVLPRPAPRPRTTPVVETIAQPPAPVTADAAPAPAPAAAPAATVQLASIDPEALAIGTSVAPLVSQISLPATIKVLPPPAPGVPPPSPAQRLHLEGASRAKAEKCLSNAIYFEARDQPYQGQVAVAQVVMNRVFSGVYPHDVCGVIYQNANRHLACQFTFACDGKRKVINERAEWARAHRIARDTLDGVLYVQAVGTATHYHANYVHPNWVREMKRFAREGEHLFYRPIAWGNGSNEPRWSRAQKKKK